MGKEREQLDLQGIVSILRQATKFVQLAPFLYAVVFILSLCLYFIGNDALSKWLDTLFYASPIFIGFALILSRLFRLCKWHRRACLIPLFPQIVGIVNYYIVELPMSVVFINLCVVIICTVLFLLSAYKVFFANGLHN